MKAPENRPLWDFSWLFFDIILISTLTLTGEGKCVWVHKKYISASIKCVSIKMLMFFFSPQLVSQYFISSNWPKSIQMTKKAAHESMFHFHFVTCRKKKEGSQRCGKVFVNGKISSLKKTSSIYIPLNPRLSCQACFQYQSSFWEPLVEW